MMDTGCAYARVNFKLPRLITFAAAGTLYQSSMRLLTILLATLTTPLAMASEFMGIFLQGQRIGYIHSVVSNTPDGKTSSLVTTHIGAKVLGQGMTMRIVSSSVRKGPSLEAQKFTIDSGGRSQNIAATFAPTEISVVRMIDGKEEKKTIPIPAGALVLDDPTVGLLGKGAPEPGTKIDFYVLDPMTLALVKCAAEYVGPSPFEYDYVKGIDQKIKIIDPRATSEIWLDSKGQMAFGTGPLGMTMRPITREEAVGSEGYLPEVDIASASRVVPDKPIESPKTIKSLKLRLVGASLPRLAGDYFQTVTRNEDGSTTLTVHPPAVPSAPSSVAKVGPMQPEFLKATTNIPATADEMVALAKQVVGNETNSFKAAQAISNHVFKIMRPNASIGVLRDAREILRTKEGVCRDYATLAATLMRAAGIPTKLVTGTVYSNDGFYYHAWVESWVGDRWIAFDPTLGGGLADATHIKFAEGHAEEAFLSFTLEGAKIEVLDIVR